jgi:hypothetical protein
MVGFVHSLWARTAAVAVLAAWLPCAPIGLCARMESTAPAAHRCCPQPVARMASAPQECWIQSSTPAPTTPTAPTMPVPDGVAFHHARAASPISTLNLPAPPAFSPLAVVLRI